MHQIGETGRVTLEDKTFEVELKIHHQGRTYQQCVEDCPKEWQIPTHWLLQSMRNIPETRDKFGLVGTWEFVQNPDAISRNKGYVAWLDAGSSRAVLDCYMDPTNRGASLGVRYAREISE